MAPVLVSWLCSRLGPRPRPSRKRRSSAGAYLVNTVMTCNNCHTPMGPNGPQFDKALSGGLRFNEPPFDVTGVQPHAGSRDRPRQMERRRHQEGIAGGRAAERPSPGRSHAHRLLQDSHARRSRRHHRLSALAETDQQQGERSRLQDGHPAQGVSRRRASPCRRPISATRSNADSISSPSPIAWSATRRSVRPARERIFRIRSARAAANFPARGVRRPRATSPRARPSGIGDWSDADIKRAITQGVRKDGSRLKPPMGYGYYAKMTDGDLDAMIAYLRTVPAKE